MHEYSTRVKSCDNLINWNATHYVELYIMVAVPSSSPETLLDADALQRLYATLQTFPVVQQISYSVAGGLVHVWVLLRHEDEETARKIVAAEVAFRQELGAPPVDV